MKLLKYSLIIIFLIGSAFVVFSQQFEFKVSTFTEDFFSLANSDVFATSANWSIDSGVVRLNRWMGLDGKSDYLVLPTKNNKQISAKINNIDASLNVVWVSGAPSDVYFSKWNGTAWVKMNGSPGYDNVSENPGNASDPVLEIDSLGRPQVVWVDDSLGMRNIYFSYWNGSAWSGLSERSSKYDNLTLSEENSILPVLKIDLKNNPNILYRQITGTGHKLYFSKWNSTAWTKANSATPGKDAIMTEDGWVISSHDLELYNDVPYIAFSRISMAGLETLFTKWSSTAWTFIDGQTEGSEKILSDTATFDFTLDFGGNPIFSWLNHSDKNIYFKRWQAAKWSEPVKISAGGGASSPFIKVSGNGTIGVSWKNEFTNIVYFTQEKAGKWTAVDGTTPGAGKVLNAGVSDFKYIFDKNSNPVFGFNKYFSQADAANYVLFFTKWNGSKWTGADNVSAGSDKTGICAAKNLELLYNSLKNNYYIICFDAGNERIYGFSDFYPVSQEAISSRIFTAKSGAGIYNAKLFTKQNVPSGTSVEYFFSVDDGATWHSAIPNKLFEFPEPGKDLRWKAKLSTTDASKTPSVSELKIEYTVSVGAPPKAEEIKAEEETVAEIKPESELKLEELVGEAEKEIIIEIKEAPGAEAPLISKAGEALSGAAAKIIPKVHTEAEQQSPTERVIDVSSQVVTATSATTAVAVSTGVTAISTARVAASIFDLPLFIVRFLSGILSFLGLKRKKVLPWGIVYDSQTKQPLDPAQVSLFTEKGETISTAITDLDGRFGFYPDPGRYKLSAVKTNYFFPSQKLFGQPKDEIYENLYFGEIIEVKEKGAPVNINIPMDPMKFDWNEFAKKELGYIKINPKKEKIKNIFIETLFYSGVASAPAFYLFNPTKLNLFLIFFYLFFVIVRILGVKRRSFGLVYEEKTNSSLSFAVVKVYYADLNYMLKSTVCDKFGRYHLIVPKGKYYLIVEKKEPDGSYKLAAKTSNFTIRKGYINLKIKL